MQFSLACLPATLILENGIIFHGTSIGAKGHAIGEMVFNTSMTGYQEILTDPSYAGQMITFTCPHIGNVGVNPVDYESDKVWTNGVIIRNLSHAPSNWRATQSLDGFLKDHNIVGISDIDTRALVQILRTQGSLDTGMRGCIVSDDLSVHQALEMMRNWKMETIDLLQNVSTKSIYTIVAESEKCRLVVYDFGVKQNILDSLHSLGCTLTIVPWDTPVQTVLDLRPDGILLSNGPGDPRDCVKAIQATKTFLAEEIPIFGICLGHQILALTCGAQIFKMAFGHHGSNHPVMEVKTQKTFITSQNHNYAVDQDALPKCLEITHTSLFDQTIQGLRHRVKPAIGFQGHPEASPGPHDMQHVFHQFLEMINHA